MRRRSFLICLAGAATAGPNIASAQRRQIRRIGFISGASFAAASPHLAGFPRGMREHGYTEGKDFTIEWRFADGNYDRFPRIAAELAELKVDVIVLGTSAAIRAVEQETAEIPIVMGYSVDPVGNGFIASLARPGGRVTGLTSSLEEVVSKQVQFLAMSVPEMTRIGLLANPTNPVSPPAVNGAEAAVRHIGLGLVSLSASDVRGVDAAFSIFASERVGGIIVLPDAFFSNQRQQLADLALQAGLPSIFAQREYAESGGLMSYGESLFEFFRRAATFVDKIFKGAKPADLPVEQPTFFRLVINRKTADLLGLSIPAQLYALADEVIE